MRCNECGGRLECKLEIDHDFDYDTREYGTPYPVFVGHCKSCNSRDKRVDVDLLNKLLTKLVEEA